MSKERGVRQGGKGLHGRGRKGYDGEGKTGRRTRRAIVSLRLRAGRKTEKRKTYSVIVDGGGGRMSAAKEKRGDRKRMRGWE